MPPYHVIISNVHVCSFRGMTSHMHKRAPKMVLRARNLVNKKLYSMKIGIPYEYMNFLKIIHKDECFIM